MAWRPAGQGERAGEPSANRPGTGTSRRPVPSGWNKAGSLLSPLLGYTHQSRPQSEQMYRGVVMVTGSGSLGHNPISNCVTATLESSGTITAVYGFVLSAQTKFHPAPRPRLVSAVVLRTRAMRQPSSRSSRVARFMPRVRCTVMPAVRRRADVPGCPPPGRSRSREPTSRMPRVSTSGWSRSRSHNRRLQGLSPLTPRRRLNRQSHLFDPRMRRPSSPRLQP